MKVLRLEWFLTYEKSIKILVIRLVKYILLDIISFFCTFLFSEFAFCALSSTGGIEEQDTWTNMSKKSTTNTTPEKEAESNYEKWIKKFPDFTLVANSGEELKCHKIVLTMHSPVFDTMISSQFKEAKSNRATMKEFDAAVNVFS